MSPPFPSHRPSASGSLLFGRKLRLRPGARMRLLQWFQAMDRLSFERLADPGKLPTLDTKLGAGLQKAARGDLARQITLAEEIEAKAADPEDGLRVAQA